MIQMVTKKTTPKNLFFTWGQVIEWYLNQCEDQIAELLDNVDNVLIYIGGDTAAEAMREEDRAIAVHPNVAGV